MTITWPDVLGELRRRPPGTTLGIPKALVVHPVEQGAKRSVGLHVGQQRDYRFPPERDGAGMHIHEYSHHWVAHLDRVHPDRGPLRHLRTDAPGVWMVGTSVAGALAGALLTKSAGGTLVGAGLGLLFGAARNRDGE